MGRYLAARDGRLGELVGQLVCPISRLPVLVSELARVGPAQPVDLSLVVDTGLGVPKALSTVLSRASLLTPCTVETAAPPDVDAVWLERVSGSSRRTWSRSSSRGGPPTTTRGPPWPGSPRCAGWPSTAARPSCAPVAARASDVPLVSDVEDFLRVAVEAGRSFTVFGLRRVVRSEVGGLVQHGLLNMLVAVARAVAGPTCGRRCRAPTRPSSRPR